MTTRAFARWLERQKEKQLHIRSTHARARNALPCVRRCTSPAQVLTRATTRCCTLLLLCARHHVDPWHTLVSSISVARASASFCGLFLLEPSSPRSDCGAPVFCGGMMRFRCGAMPSGDIAPFVEEPEVALAACASHRHAYLHCPWPRVGLPCLTQVPMPEWVVPQYGPMYVCFLPEQDMAESPTSQDSERTSTAMSGPCACVYRVEAQRRGTLHVHSLAWQLPTLDVGDSGPPALAADGHSSASSASLRDYVSGYCSMRDPRYRRGEGATRALKITQEDLA